MLTRTNLGVFLLGTFATLVASGCVANDLPSRPGDTGGSANSGGNSTGNTSTTGGTKPNAGSTSAAGQSTAGGTSGASGVGGTANAGGMGGAGGTTSTGGAANSGGLASTGGMTTSGGSSTTGGLVSAGGTKATGGATSSSVSSATGGAITSGGTISTGGTIATAGATSTGGTTSAGGTTTTGGASSVGGTASAGASLTVGGSGGTLIPTDANAVANDKAALAIIYASGDSASSVTQSITLPTEGANGSTISWSSNHPTIVSASGTVVRPTTTTAITLTATITKGSASDTMAFPITVIISDAGVVANDKAALQIAYTGADTALSVTQNLTLATTGAGGSTIGWNSAPSGIIDSTGIVTRPSVTTAVTLTATLTKGSSSDTKIFIVYATGSATQLGFLYAAGQGISAYRINTDGSLTAVPGSPFGTGYFSFVTVTPSNKFLYTFGSGLDSFSINPDGSLVSIYGSPSTIYDGANSIAVNPASTFAYVTNAGSTSSTIAVYSISSSGLPVSTGTPISIAPEGNPTFSVVDPTGQYLYVADSNGVPGTAKVGAYSIGADGSLTLVGSPIAGDSGNYGNSIAITPSGKYVYMSNSDTVSAYSTNLDGSLTSLGLPYGADGGGYYEAANIAIDPMGRFLYVPLDWFGGAVTSFKLNTDGSLSGKVTNPVTTASYSVISTAIDRTGTYAYVTDTDENLVAMFSINSSTGSFTPLASPTISCSAPKSLATTH